MIVTTVLCVIVAVIAFPVFAEAQGVPTAIPYTLIGFEVIWCAYFARAWVFSKRGFWSGERVEKEPE